MGQNALRFRYAMTLHNLHPALMPNDDADQDREKYTASSTARDLTGTPAHAKLREFYQGQSKPRRPVEPDIVANLLRAQARRQAEMREISERLDDVARQAHEYYTDDHTLLETAIAYNKTVQWLRRRWRRLGLEIDKERG